MPRVPRIEPNRVRETAEPTVRNTATPDIAAFGGGSAAQGAFEASGKLAKQAGDIYDDMRAQVVKTETKAHELPLSQLQSQIEVSVSQMKGKNAVGATDFAKENWDKGVDDLLKGIDDPDVKAAIQASANNKFAKVYDSSLKHTGKEFQSYQNQAQESFVQTVRNDAIKNYQDPAAVKEGLTKQVQSIMDHGRTQGWDKATTDAALDNAVSQTHLGVVNRMIADDVDMVASDYFKKFKDQMTEKDFLTAEKLVEDASLRGNSQRNADKIVASGLDAQQALEQARMIKDPKERDATVKRVKSRFAEQKAAREQSIEELHRRAGNFLYGDNPEKSKGDIDAYAKANPADWARFSVSEKRQLEGIAQKLKFGQPIETNPQTYYKLVTMSSSPETRDAFLRLNLSSPKYLADLSPSDFQEMTKLQASLRKGEKTPKFKGVQTRKQIIDRALRTIDIDPRTDNPDELERISQFYGVVEERVAQEQERRGKDLTNDEIESLVNKFTAETVIERPFWFDSKKPYFETQSTPAGQIKFETDFDDIPPAERDKISRELERNNIPWSEDRVVEEFLKDMQGFVRGE